MGNQLLVTARHGQMFLHKRVPIWQRLGVQTADMEDAQQRGADRLDLTNVCITTAEDVTTLINCVLERKPGEVILSGCQLSDEFSNQIVECCALNENLRVLDMSNNSLSEQGCRALHVLLNSNKCVESINILNNPIAQSVPGVGSNPFLARLLKIYSESRYLRSICGCTVNSPVLMLPAPLVYEQEVELLIAELKKNTDLKSLHIVGDHTAQDILTAVDSNKTLVRLFFEGFHANTQLSSALGLSTNVSLKTLQIRWNDASTEKDAETLVVWLQKSLSASQHVTTLQLDAVPLDRELFECLAEMLQANRGLVHLALFNIPWTMESRVQLLSAVVKNSSLRLLHVTTLSDEDDVWRELEDGVVNELVGSRGYPLILRTNHAEIVFGQLSGRNASDEWEVGDRIEALYDEATWVEGELIAVTTDHKYSVLFSNGEIKNSFRGNKIRRGDGFQRPTALPPISGSFLYKHLEAARNAAARFEGEYLEEEQFVPPFCVDQAVAVRFYGDSLYYPAVIRQITCDCLFTVQVEGLIQARELERHLVFRFVPPNADPSQYDAGFYQRGDYVDVYFAHDEQDYTGAWKRGRIAHDNRDGTYYVRLENGSDLAAVRGRDVRFHFRAKDRVDVRLQEGIEWCKGRIMKVEGNGIYYVKYEVLECADGAPPQVITYQEHSVAAARLMPDGREDARLMSMELSRRLAEVPAADNKSNLSDLIAASSPMEFGHPSPAKHSIEKIVKPDSLADQLGSNGASDHSPVVKDTLSSEKGASPVPKSVRRNGGSRQASEQLEANGKSSPAGDLTGKMRLSNPSSRTEAEAGEGQETPKPSRGVPSSRLRTAESPSGRIAGGASKPNKYKVGAKVQCLHTTNQWLNAVVSDNYIPGVYTLLLLESPDGDSNAAVNDSAVYTCTEDMLRSMKQAVENSFENSPRSVGRSVGLTPANGDGVQSLSGAVQPVNPSSSQFLDGPNGPEGAPPTSTMAFKEGMRVHYYPEDGNALLKYVGFVEEVHRSTNMYTIVVDDESSGQVVYTVPARKVQPVRAALSRSPDVRAQRSNTAQSVKNAQEPAAEGSPAVASETMTVPASGGEEGTCASFSGAAATMTPVRPSEPRHLSFSSPHRHLQSPSSAPAEAATAIENAFPEVLAGTDSAPAGRPQHPQVVLHHFAEFSLAHQDNPLLLRMEALNSSAVPHWELDVVAYVECVLHPHDPREASVSAEVHCHVGESLLNVFSVRRSGGCAPGTNAVAWRLTSERAVLPLFVGITAPAAMPHLDRAEIRVRMTAASLLVATISVCFSLGTPCVGAALQRTSRDLVRNAIVCELPGLPGTELGDSIEWIRCSLPHMQVQHVIAVEQAVAALGQDGRAWESVQVIVPEESLQLHSWGELTARFGLAPLLAAQDVTITVLSASAGIRAVLGVDQHSLNNDQYPILHLRTLPQETAYVHVARGLPAEAGDSKGAGADEWVRYQSLIERYWAGCREAQASLPCGLLLLPADLSRLAADSSEVSALSQPSMKAALHAYILGQCPDAASAPGVQLPSGPSMWFVSFQDIRSSSLVRSLERHPLDALSTLSLLRTAPVQAPSLELLTLCAPWMRLSVLHCLLVEYAAAPGDMGMAHDATELLLLYDFFHLLSRTLEDHQERLSPSWRSACLTRLANFSASPEFHCKDSPLQSRLAGRLEQAAQHALGSPAVIGGPSQIKNLAKIIRLHLDNSNPLWMQQLNVHCANWVVDGQRTQVEWVSGTIWDSRYRHLASHLQGREASILLDAQTRSAPETPRSVVVESDANVSSLAPGGGDVGSHLLSDVGVKDAGMASSLAGQLAIHGCTTWQEFLDIFFLISQQPGTNAANVGEKLKALFSGEMRLPLLASMKLTMYLVRVNSQ